MNPLTDANSPQYQQKRFGNLVSLYEFGATGDGTTDDTAAVQAAFDSGKPLFAPAGTYKLTATVQIPGNSTLVGASANTSIFKSTVSGTTAIFGKKASVTTYTRYVYLSRIRIEGTDGSGGTGIWMNTFRDCFFEDIYINLCRNAGDTGRGIYLENQYGNNSFNTFVGVKISNSDNALVFANTNGTYACGYATFHGLMIDEEVNCINIGANCQYSSFFGITIQGSGSSGTAIQINGYGNQMEGIVYDGGVAGLTALLAFGLAGSSANYVKFLEGFDATKITNNQSTGQANTIIGGAVFTVAPSKQMAYVDPIGAATFSIQGALTNSGTEIRMGNATRSTQWQLATQGAASPFFTITGNAATKIYIAQAAAGNIGFHGVANAGNGQGVLWLANAVQVPSTNPTGGGCIYCEAGALKYRGTSGTVTVLGAA